MLYLLLFVLGVLVGSLPLVRRCIESARWVLMYRWAERCGIHAEDIPHAEALRLMEQTPPPKSLRLRRAK